MDILKIDELNDDVIAAEADVEAARALLEDTGLIAAKRVFDLRNTISVVASDLADAFKAVYDLQTETWSNWCEANLTTEEKDYILALLNMKVKDLI